jgi:hypothetical protein
MQLLSIWNCLSRYRSIPIKFLFGRCDHIGQMLLRKAVFMCKRISILLKRASNIVIRWLNNVYLWIHLVIICFKRKLVSLIFWILKVRVVLLGNWFCINDHLNALWKFLLSLAWFLDLRGNITYLFGKLLIYINYSRTVSLVCPNPCLRPHPFSPLSHRCHQLFPLYFLKRTDFLRCRENQSVSCEMIFFSLVFFIKFLHFL